MEALNEALSSQQQQLDELTYKLRHVIDKVKSIEPSNMAKDSEETPPPHY
ncbi:SlyX family protein [Alteromonas stellipolaris]|nr:SlyX family protein [Alteromonas stellipolaris]